LKLKIPAAILFATVMLLMMVTIPFPTKADVGPRTEDLVIRFYADVVAAYAALKAGAIDAVGYEITSTQYANAITDPNIGLGPVGDRGKYEFDINNNYTAQDLNDGRRSPTNYLNFRKGIAFCVDKSLIVDTFCGGFADRIDQPISYQHRGWRNQSYWYEDGTYPYECNLVQASAAFDAAGFVQGSDPNPNYDAGVPGSVPNLRIHPESEVTMNYLEMCTRSDDARRLQAGNELTRILRLVGIPVNQVEASSAVLYPKVMDNFDYHIYTGGWSLGRFPAISAYGMYHSSQYMLGGSNYVTGNDSMGNPMYPALDGYLYNARFPADYAEAQSAARNAFGEHVKQCVTIELFSARSFWAWSSDLKGVVNANGAGLENGYTFLNAYKVSVSGGPLYYGLKTPPNAMNKIYSQWYYDYQCLDRMDLYSGINTAPYDQSVDQNGYITSWTTSTWVDPDDPIDPKSKISQTYRDDAWFVEPDTGNQLEHVNITHHYASIWYEYQLSDAWCNDGVSDIKTVRMVGDHGIEMYWNIPGYWNTYMGGTSIKSFNWWSKGTLSKTVTDNNLVPDGSGYVGCTEPVFYVLSITGDDTPLTVGVDYDIYIDPDGPHNADVRIITGSYADVDITYLATDDAHGYTPGNLPWQDAFEGAGMYYATDFIPGSGGHLTLNRSAFYPMERPPLGEIDFIKKPNGCYKIDIFDVVIAASAYGSQGSCVPDSRWFPGADLAPEFARTVTIRPNGPGTFTQWTPHPLAFDNWQCVDEATANGNEDYVHTTDNSSQDSYNLKNPNVGTCGKIGSITVIINGSALNEGDKLRTKLVIDGISYYGETHTLTSNYVAYESSWSTNPQTGQQWTWSEIDDLEVGFESGEVVLPPMWKVTQLYVVVKYKVLCSIDIYDILTITGKYGTQYDCP